MIVKGRWYKTADGRLVRENDPEAAFLAYVPGEEVADPEARKVGLLALEKEPDHEPADEKAAGEKRGQTAANKAVGQSPNK